MSAAKEMRKSMAECRRQIRDLESQSKKLESPAGTTASSSDLLASAIEYLRKGTSSNIRHQFSEMDEGEDHADEEDEEEEDETSHDQIENDAKAIRIADALAKIHQNLSEKLQGAFYHPGPFQTESSITNL
jgi:TATA-binding protein-associated factor Taf7